MLIPKDFSGLFRLKLTSFFNFLRAPEPLVTVLREGSVLLGSCRFPAQPGILNEEHHSCLRVFPGPEAAAILQDHDGLSARAHTRRLSQGRGLVKASAGGPISQRKSAYGQSERDRTPAGRAARQLLGLCEGHERRRGVGHDAKCDRAISPGRQKAVTSDE